MGEVAVPDDPVLASAARTAETLGFAIEIWDADWRLAYLSSEYRELVSGMARGPEVGGFGEHILSRETTEERETWPTVYTLESWRENLRSWVGYIADTTPGGVEALREVADPRLAVVLDDAEERSTPAVWGVRLDVKLGDQTIPNDALLTALRDEEGRFHGAMVILKPGMRAGVLGMLATGDADLFERMSHLMAPARHPAAILFADLESSTALARRLSTRSYFDVIRRLVRASDNAVVAEGGIVGKHVGDGVTAFFLVEEGVSESAAASACIASMRGIREAARSAAERSGLDPAEVRVRFGLHWGAMLYVGRLMTSGRAEVTALGDEVNEAARIEACATGGRALASKPLVERLDPPEADALEISPDRLSYTSLAELPTATEKARRDAPAISVCEL